MNSPLLLSLFGALSASWSTTVVDHERVTTTTPREASAPASGSAPASASEPPKTVEGRQNNDPAGHASTSDAAGDTATESALAAMEHLARAQELAATGALSLAEAEASVAISLQPHDAAAYLERAQLRLVMADQIQDDARWAHRARAGLLRLAADDVDSYLRYAELTAESETWFQARRQAIRREADALDPPTPTPAAPFPEPEPEPEPVRPTTTPSPAATSATTSATTSARDPQPRDTDHRRRSRALLSSGAIMGAGAAGLAAASLRIEQACAQTEQTGPSCQIRWRAQAPLLAPAAVLTALSTTSVVLGVLDAPGLDRPRVRRATSATTLALGSTAAALGVITGAIAAAQWYAPLSPSDDRALSTTQTLANTSAASVAIALPLLSAGLTAWLRARRSQSDGARALTPRLEHPLAYLR
ncbi:MAG: hypothetical protein AAGF11_49720 [Myxococcota bacterium]